MILHVFHPVHTLLTEMFRNTSKISKGKKVNLITLAKIILRRKSMMLKEWSVSFYAGRSLSLSKPPEGKLVHLGY